MGDGESAAGLSEAVGVEAGAVVGEHAADRDAEADAVVAGLVTGRRRTRLRSHRAAWR